MSEEERRPREGGGRKRFTPAILLKAYGDPHLRGGDGLLGPS